MRELKSSTGIMHLNGRKIVTIGFLCTCMLVGIQGEQLDCSVDCACCKGGQSRCGNDPIRNNVCFDGCIPTKYGYKCKNPCWGNCFTCEQAYGLDCYTCKDSFYDISNRCTKTCSNGCQGGVCEDNGTCECYENFKGPKCETCVSGKYGTNCSQDCLYSGCRCTAKYDCDSCRDGYYDLKSNCSKVCSVGCVNGICYDNGICNCSRNFTGTLCTDCIPGLFGRRCDRVCYHKKCLCSSEFNCIHCKPGYFNITNNCLFACSSGCDNICEDDGSCTCKLHNTGVRCDVCESGYFGNDCSHECGIKDAQCLNCDRSGAVCHLCANGYYPNTNGSCILCGENCIGGVCNATNGKCSLGCKSGHWGARCESACNTNCTTCAHFSGVCEHCTSQEVHGLFCNMTCSKHCLGNVCDRDSGNCFKGCIKDYYGPQCDNRCSDTCKAIGEETTCDEVGYCFNGCVNGYFGDDCRAEPYEMTQTAKSEQKMGQVDNDEEEYERITVGQCYENAVK
ncbi:USH2A-like protein [Mya arenaria]|uniref:USH2A-like protein n=1 Tax=Mya arenaria TaxID=6604 RepID=A0ABY7F4C5_MYAAR|nr:USH2A-like protein [Mya arenaria]